MGTTTPNMSIYVPAAGETNYDSAFAAGMTNIDQHDHSGAPNKGVPLSSSGLANFSVTYEKLNANVVLAGGGLAVDSGTPNKLKVDGILLPIFQLASNGVICRTSASTVSARTITGTANQITVTNGDGVSGNPTLSIPATFDLTGTDIICESVTINGVSAAADATPLNVTLNHNYRTMIQVTNTTDGTGAYAGLHISGSGTQFALMEVMADLYSNVSIAGYCFFNMTTTNGCIWQVDTNKVFKWSHGSVSAGTIMVLDANTPCLYPNPTNTMSLGKSGQLWTEVWATNATIQTSDERLKRDIYPTELGLNFINDLKPKSFKWKDGKRDHQGFIAQQVKQVMDKYGTDFPAYIDPSVNDPSDQGSLALRYDEFIAPMVRAIQELAVQVNKCKSLLGVA
jgi:hypothetical protein